MPNPRPGGSLVVTLVLSLLAAGCTPRVICRAQGGKPRTQESSAAAAEYLATAEPANPRLDAEVQSYADHERRNLATAEAALRAFTHRHQSADAAVEAQVKAIRRVLGLPPRNTS
jgi:hypothetical protein